MKRTKVVGHTNAEFHLEMLNAFNHANFTPVGGIGGTQLSNYQRRPFFTYARSLVFI